MSNAIAVIAANVGAGEEEVTEILKGMIISSKNQHGAVATNAELAVVAGVCKTYNLNPLVKECAAFISGGKLQVVVMIDGWYRIVNRQPDFDGVEFDDALDDKGSVVATTCRMFLKNRARPVCVTEYLVECRDPKSSVWTKWPARMLRHKAYIQCARMAFGMSGIIDDDEAARISSNQIEKDVTPAPVLVDWAVIDSEMAECADLDGLKATSSDIRARMEADGTWARNKSELVLLNAKHRERIERDYAEQVVVVSEVIEGELVTEESETEVLNEA